MDVPEVVVNRLPQYVRGLTDVHHQGTEIVSSHTLGQILHVTPAQIRKDLSYFGRFGKQGRGYSVHDLLDHLRELLTSALEGLEAATHGFLDLLVLPAQVEVDGHGVSR